MESQLQIYSGISIFGYVLAAVFLVASVAIFFLMDIKGVYAYLSGRKQQKGIMEMREKQQEDNNASKPIPDSARLGFTPPPKSASKKINKEPKAKTNNNVVQPKEDYTSGTVNLKDAGNMPDDYVGGTVNLKNAGNMPDDYATSVLSNADLPQQAASDAASDDYPTDVLNAVNINCGSFTLIKNVMEIHTSEVL